MPDPAPARNPGAAVVLRRALTPLYRLATRLEVEGASHIPARGGCVLVFNHLSNFDPHLIFTLVERGDAAGLVAAEYRERFVTRWPIEAAGGIWLRRGKADWRALRAALAVLEGGGLVGIAPEGMRSPTRALVEGRRGPAFLALRAGVQVLPVAVTGTELMAAALPRARRPRVRVRFGPPFWLPPLPRVRRKQHMQACTDTIMLHLAALLPPEYRGAYAIPSLESRFPDAGTCRTHEAGAAVAVAEAGR